jgi:DNA-binding FadR family transcriptional regulator
MKSAAQRMAAYRRRRRESGLVPVSLLVPERDKALLQAIARQRRERWAAAPAAPRSDHKRIAGQAHAITETLLRRVIHSGWPVGQALGSESDLMQEFAVSRSVLRQAVRLLEQDGVARMRRGATGGLVVAAPDATSTMRAVRILLEYQRIRPVDILATRQVLEQATVSLAVARLSAAGAARLRAVIDAEAELDGSATGEDLQRFHFAVAELSGDPALRLFTDIVLRLSDAHSTFARRPRADRDRGVARIKRLHRTIAEAIIARDAAAASRRIRRYLEGYRDWMD